MDDDRFPPGHIALVALCWVIMTFSFFGLVIVLFLPFISDLERNPAVYGGFIFAFACAMIFLKLVVSFNDREDEDD